METFESPWKLDIPSPSAFQTGENETENTNLLQELGIDDSDETEETEVLEEEEIVEEIKDKTSEEDLTKTPPVKDKIVKEFEFDDNSDNTPPEAPFEKEDIKNPFEDGMTLPKDPDKKYPPERVKTIPKKPKYHITNLFTLINFNDKTDKNEVDVMELDFNADFGNLRISFSRIEKALESHKLFKNEMKRVAAIAVYPEDCIAIQNIEKIDTVYCIEKLIRRTNEPWEIERPQCYVSRKTENVLPEIKVDSIDFTYSDMINAGWTHEKLLNSEYSDLAKKADNTKPTEMQVIQVNIGEYYFKLTEPNDIECFMIALKFITNQGFMLRAQRGFLPNE